METHTRFRFRDDGTVYRISGHLQVKMEIGEVYNLEKSNQSIRLEASNHCLQTTMARPLALVRYSSPEPSPQTEKVRVQLKKPGLYKVAPEFGFRVRLPHEETDPVLRVARTIGIPISKVFRNMTATTVEGPPPPPNCEPIPSPKIHALMGARVQGKVVELNQTGVLVETYEKPILSGTGRFVSRLVVGPLASPKSVQRSLEMLSLTHTPEWDVGDPTLLSHAQGVPA